MSALHALPEDQLRREIEALREQAAACPPHAGLLQAERYSSLLRKMWGLENELRRRKAESSRAPKREYKRLKLSWAKDASRGNAVARRMEREAQKRLKFLLEIPEEPKPVPGLARALGIV